MSSLTSYNGLSVLTPEPTASGGKAINDNFKALSTAQETTNPVASNDSTEGYSTGSRWYNSSTRVEWVCTDAAVGAAVWSIIASPSQWTTSGSAIYFDGGNVGIGTTSPGFPLQIAADSGIFVAPVVYDSPYPGTISTGGVIINPRGINICQDGATTPFSVSVGIGMASNRSDPLLLICNNGGPSAIFEIGNVGIGTTSPATALDVSGASSSDSFVAKPQSSAPASPVAGQIYFNSGTGHFYGWNGTAWAQLDN